MYTKQSIIFKETLQNSKIKEFLIRVQLSRVERKTFLYGKVMTLTPYQNVYLTPKI
jgi:hypothetical protein